jgi:hypothetical protein
MSGTVEVISKASLALPLWADARTPRSGQGVFDSIGAFGSLGAASLAEVATITDLKTGF